MMYDLAVNRRPIEKQKGSAESKKSSFQTSAAEVRPLFQSLRDPLCSKFISYGKDELTSKRYKSFGRVLTLTITYSEKTPYALKTEFPLRCQRNYLCKYNHNKKLLFTIVL